MTTATPRRPPDDGLQPERTALAWSRTSLGFLANGALLLLREAAHESSVLRLLPAALAVSLAVALQFVARSRRRELDRRPLPDPLAARRRVYGIGVAMVVLVTVSVTILEIG